MEPDMTQATGATQAVKQLVTRYRRVKQDVNIDDGHSSEEEEDCDIKHGHVLSFHDDLIICRYCGAVWRDEGF